MMRSRMVAAFALLLAFGPAGCARTTDDGTDVATARSAGATPSGGPSATASDDPDAPLKFARCMREHGMTWFPDPGAGGKMQIRIPEGVPREKMDAAQQACKQFLPNGGVPQRLSAEQLEQLRKLAKCMRDNGVPKFPDPDPAGGLAIDGDKIGMGPGDPTFDKADKACAKFAPHGPTGGSARAAGVGEHLR